MTFIPYTPPSGAVVTPPVHAETIVTVFYSDGDRDSRLAAGNVNWSAEGDGPRVVAYRVVEEYTPPKVPREWWLNVYPDGYLFPHDTRAEAQAILGPHGRTIRVREVIE